MKTRSLIPAPVARAEHSTCARTRGGLGPDSKINSRGDTLLHGAVLQGNVEALKLLLAAGVDPNTLGDYGDTALHWGVYRERHKSMAILLLHGTNMHIKNHAGDSALDVARMWGCATSLSRWHAAAAVATPPTVSGS